MNVRRAFGLPATGCLGRVLIEDGLAVEVTFDEPDALAVANIDGRVDDHLDAIAFLSHCFSALLWEGKGNNYSLVNKHNS